MELKVFWLELAQRKLEDIYAYYAIKANKRTAKNLVIGIVDKTFRIENHPEIGQIETSLIHRKLEFRYLVHKNYKIIYWVNRLKGRVEIVNIFDTRQNPTKISETR
jgi:plasmid stabilization system protein ParE